MKSVAAYKAEWEAKRKQHPPAKPRPKIHGKTLVESLERLAEETDDERFRAALAAIEDLALIDEEGNFRRNRRVHPDSLTHQYGPDDIFEWVEKLVIHFGANLSQAYASIAADWGEPADEFATAMKRVEKLYREGQRKAYPYGPPINPRTGTKTTP